MLLRTFPPRTLGRRLKDVDNDICRRAPRKSTNTRQLSLKPSSRRGGERWKKGRTQTYDRNNPDDNAPKLLLPCLWEISSRSRNDPVPINPDDLGSLAAHFQFVPIVLLIKIACVCCFARTQINRPLRQSGLWISYRNYVCYVVVWLFNDVSNWSQQLN